MKKIMLTILCMLLLISVASSQLGSTPELLDWKCEWIDKGYDKKTFVTKNMSQYHASNDSTSYWVEYVRTDVVHVEDYVLECEKFMRVDGKNVDFKIQGYNCKNTAEGMVCDSCTDGNCDGKCSSNGGETCCKVSNKGLVTCKNSAVTWTENKALPVKELSTK
jgi:hypothetical protein